ncbi:hypothetical protein MTBBW1_1230002 [Desulfamplus magnetovallimortis]|uniref:Peptidase C-terminal archaeal/bacterial domain-containing protein n=1 Tax=Desulfamplus magnetovallimortis TaxID=1246637 RepID=A0A1W1H6B7_9BACT|nr:hypothetical protein [Desulfamplus magnetovallimortis]SLM28031.1 hypothetical protein MTBBW1_1230002 [Desulfamplus magnetovallimortis]
MTASYGIKSDIFDIGNETISESYYIDFPGMASNTTYFFRFVAVNSAGTTYGSDQTFTTTALATDDYGDNCTSAQVININSTIAGEIEIGDDSDHFKITLPSQGTLQVYTSGDLDTLGDLKNAACTDIADDDDDGDSLNFLISEDLSAGTYYIAVRSYMSSIGTYTLNTEFTSVAGNTESYHILTDQSEPITINDGEFVKLYGSAGVNRIDLKSGGQVECINFPGLNLIGIEGNSYEFDVYRSGATIFLENATEGTKIKIPATNSAQSLIFSDESVNMIISNGKVMLGSQEITITKMPVTVESSDMLF